MKNIFNRFADFVKGPTRLLHEELSKSPFTMDLKRTKSIQNALPSVARVQDLIDQGANVNTFLQHHTQSALMICAKQYRTMMLQSEAPTGTQVFLDTEMTKEYWKACAQHYLDAAVLLQKSGAIPTWGPNNYARETDWPDAQNKSALDFVNDGLTEAQKALMAPFFEAVVAKPARDNFSFAFKP